VSTTKEDKVKQQNNANTIKNKAISIIIIIIIPLIPLKTIKVIEK
jgi:hypothetical protein